VFPYAASDLAASYGYHPDVADLEAAAKLAEQSYLLVVGASPDLRDQVDQMRVWNKGELALPNGLYWFPSTKSPVKLMAVFTGQSPASGEAVSTDALSEDHPLVWAKQWMESLWSESAVVPMPRFKPSDRSY
jgi:hypothetical protein